MFTRLLQYILFAGDDSLWLGIAVGADAEMTPRVQLGSVPYAVVAQTVPDGSLTTSVPSLGSPVYLPIIRR
jgi:hypothetical protein